MVNLNNAQPGDILISKHGATLEYVAPTPWGSYSYLDHVVKYIKDKDGKGLGSDNYGTRTNDGFTFLKKRLPTDHDIVKIIPLKEWNNYNNKERKNIIAEGLDKMENDNE